MAFPAFLDACVLIPITLTDTLLRLAQAETYRPLWSDQVLDEVERNLPRIAPTVTQSQARCRVAQMRAQFPDSLVTGYEAMVPRMSNDPKDRHVLAAAARGDAATIVTANLRDFPADTLRPYNIAALHPDDFLLNQLDLYPHVTIQCVREQVAAYRKPAVTITDFLARLAKAAPNFTETIGPLLGRR